jgi:ABC-type nitrate/sulfonate/bicarbonate transport system permease component
VGWAAYVPVLLAVAAGNSGLRVVSNVALLGEHGANGGVFIRTDSGITSFGALAGRKIATNAQRSLLWPLVNFPLTLPSVALLPILILALGIGPAMQVGAIAFGVFFLVLVNTTAGVRAVDPAMTDIGRAYRIGPGRRLFLLLLPAAAPQIVSAARTALSVAVLVMVISEMVGASYGIGAVTILAQQEFRYTRMWAGMVLLALLGYLLNAGFALVERCTLGRWGVLATAAAGRS